MTKVVDNMFATWAKMGVKNVFKVVDTSHPKQRMPVLQWNSLIYPSFYGHLSTLLIHRVDLAVQSVYTRLIPVIHKTYNNQLKENFNK